MRLLDKDLRAYAFICPHCNQEYTINLPKGKTGKSVMRTCPDCKARAYYACLIGFLFLLLVVSILLLLGWAIITRAKAAPVADYLVYIPLASKSKDLPPLPTPAPLPTDIIGPPPGPDATGSLLGDTGGSKVYLLEVICHWWEPDICAFVWDAANSPVSELDTDGNFAFYGARELWEQTGASGAILMLGSPFTPGQCLLFDEVIDIPGSFGPQDVNNGYPCLQDEQLIARGF